MTIPGATTLREIVAARPRPQAAVQAAIRAIVATALYALGFHAFAHVLYVLAVIALLTSIEVQIAAAIAQGFRRLWRSRKKTVPATKKRKKEMSTKRPTHAAELGTTEGASPIRVGDAGMTHR